MKNLSTTINPTVLKLISSNFARWCDFKLVQTGYVALGDKTSSSLEATITRNCTALAIFGHFFGEDIPAHVLFTLPPPIGT